MARLLSKAGLPPPRCEVVRGADRDYRLDFAYPARRLAIEVDGYVWHASPDRKTRDHERLNRLQQHGWRVLVYTWKQVIDDPEAVIQQILDAYHALAPAS